MKRNEKIEQKTLIKEVEAEPVMDEISQEELNLLKLEVNEKSETKAKPGFLIRFEKLSANCLKKMMLRCRCSVS